MLFDQAEAAKHAKWERLEVLLRMPHSMGLSDWTEALHRGLQLSARTGSLPSILLLPFEGNCESRYFGIRKDNCIV